SSVRRSCTCSCARSSRGHRSLHLRHVPTRRSSDLSGQYHFGAADNTFRPFLGLGYHQTNISNESIGSGEHVGMTTPKGAIGTAGVDININPTWFARVDARYLDGDADVKVAGDTVERDVGFDPWTIGFGVGARF